MATRQTTPARPKRQRRSQQRIIWTFGLGVLIFVLLITSLATIGRNTTEQRNARSLAPIVVSTHMSPPNAEPNGRAWGPTDAPIQVIEYVDYECESCGYFARTYEAEVIEAFAATGKVRFEIRNAPFHGEGSRNAAAAAYCAAEQNAFWPMHDSLFLNQPVIEGTGAEVFSMMRLNEIAAQLELDTTAFGQCLSTGTYDAQVAADYAETGRIGVTGTPSFVINGRMYPAVLSTDDLREIFRQVAPDVDL
ncbi:MAG TPA: thioredoxin domain-containing protein [Roseiflexaceae bacterium]|nr:thioredoxin domain-containing protein [Roseiflexaceae bacterium]